MNLFKMFNINLLPTKDVEGYENLQKRINEKNAFLEKVTGCFNELNKNLNDFSKKLIFLNSNFTNITTSLEEQNIHETCKLIYQKIINELGQNNILVEGIIKNLNEHLKAFNHEKTLYEEFKKTNKELQDEKERLVKNKELYHKAGKEAETKIKKFVQINFNQLSNLPEELKPELNNIVSPPVRTLNNYSSSVEKVNQLVNKYNLKQSKLLTYLPDLGSEDGVFFFRIVKLYLESLETGENYLNLNKKQLNDSKTVETNSKLKELIEINDIYKRNEQPVELVQYQSDLEFNKCKDENQFNIFAKSVETINKYINSNIFKNYDYNQELKKFEIGCKIKKLFDEKGDIDEKMGQDFLDSLKDTSLHKHVYIILSQLRTSNKFQRSKSLINLLGKCFNILLDEAQTNKLYENAKNSIILSQTYYYSEDDNKTKIYLFQCIKNHKWLTNPNFWRIFIEYNIHNELERYQKSNPEVDLNIEKNKNIPKRIKDKLNDIVFSQILPFTSNMIEFEIDKRIIVKIIDEFISKYNYISEQNLDAIFCLVSQSKEEIEKLRKEYDPSLEPQTAKEEAENKKEDSKEDSKQENKEEKKEEANETKEKPQETSDVKEDKKEEKDESAKEESPETKKDENN